MNAAMSEDNKQGSLSGADLAAAANGSERLTEESVALPHDANAEARATNPPEAHLAPLFSETWPR
jgi:hypothetical protein